MHTTTRPHVLAAGVAALALIGGLTACLPTEPGTERVSVDSGGGEIPTASFGADLSRDGRHVVFSTHLPSDLTDPQDRIYRKDRSTGALEMVSVDDEGGELPGRNVAASVSADGTRVAFVQQLRTENGSAIPLVLVRDLAARRTFPVSAGARTALTRGAAPEISSDGRFVTFTSDSPALVDGDTNDAPDVFVRDLTQRTTRRVSVTNGGGQLADGAEGSSISGDGRYVAFTTTANLAIADTDNTSDVYVRDTVAGTTTYESIGGTKSEALPVMDLSDDGTRLAFISRSGTSVHQTWVRNRPTGQLRLISFSLEEGAPGNRDSWEVAISRDGGHVAFSSFATNLAGGTPPGHTNVFVATSTGADLTRVPITQADGADPGTSSGPSVNDGGTTIGFHASSAGLVPGDTNGRNDVFVTRR